MLTKGIIYILIATLSFACMNFMAKMLSEMHPAQVVFFRAIGTFIFVFPFMLIKKISLKGHEPKLLLLRAVLGFLSLIMFFWAVQRIPLGTAISIRYAGPIFAGILSVFFLKEKVNIWQWIGFFVGFIGVILLKGADSRLDIWSFLMVLFSAFTVGIVFVLIRYLTAKEHPLTIINYFMIVSLIGSFCFLDKWRMPIEQEWIAVLSIGIFGLIGQVFMTFAFKYEETSVLAPFKYMELIFALIIAYVISQEGYNLMTMLSMLIIIGSLVFSVWAKKLQNKIE